MSDPVYAQCHKALADSAARTLSATAAVGCPVTMAWTIIDPTVTLTGSHNYPNDKGDPGYIVQRNHVASQIPTVGQYTHAMLMVSNDARPSWAGGLSVPGWSHVRIGTGTGVEQAGSIVTHELGHQVEGLAMSRGYRFGDNQELPWLHVTSAHVGLGGKEPWDINWYPKWHSGTVKRPNGQGEYGFTPAIWRDLFGGPAGVAEPINFEATRQRPVRTSR